MRKNKLSINGTSWDWICSSSNVIVWEKIRNKKYIVPVTRFPMKAVTPALVRDYIRLFILKKDGKTSMKVEHLTSEDTVVPASDVAVLKEGQEEYDVGYSTLYHPKTGWLISGRVQSDWLSWCDSFSAQHGVHGRVWGNIHDRVYADSISGMWNYLESHPFESVCFGDI